MKGKTISLAMSALVAVPMALHAQTSTQAQSTTQGSAQTSAQSQASAQARIDAAIHSATQAGISASLLESKVQEGQAKHVPPQRIATAVEARAHALIQADQALDRADIQNESNAELSIAADALQAGVNESALIKVYRDAPANRRVVAVAVLADLVRLGQSSANAFAQVNGALGSASALANLQAQVASQLRLGGLSSTLDATGLVHVK